MRLKDPAEAKEFRFGFGCDGFSNIEKPCLLFIGYNIQQNLAEEFKNYSHTWLLLCVFML